VQNQYHFFVSGEKAENQLQVEMLARPCSWMPQGNFFFFFVCICTYAVYICSITWPGNSQAMGMAVMLDEIINYVHSLKNQVEVSWIERKRGVIVLY
jgi:hypothetical protein